jgi:hypothetical protein
MVVVPLSKTASDPVAARPAINKLQETNWVRYAAAGTLAASGVLLVTGKQRAALLTALSGAVLVMIDQHEVVSAWWNSLPGYLDEVQGLLGRAQSAVEDLSEQGARLREVLNR